jgi:hypothetical protein
LYFSSGGTKQQIRRSNDMPLKSLRSSSSMGRMKMVLAAAGVILALLGVGTAIAMRSDGGSNRAVPVATVPDASGSGSAAVANRTPPSPEQVQAIIAGLTASILAPSGTDPGAKPITKEQVEAQLREQLKQLGITY